MIERSSNDRVAGIPRRSLLKGLGAGSLALMASGALAACTGGSPRATGGTPGQTGGTGTVAFGSGSSDPVPKEAFEAFTAAFEKKTGHQVRTTVTPAIDWQNRFSSYLQGSPGDVVTWFAGYRMQYYAKQGLLAPIDDVWEQVGSNFSAGMAEASTGQDGHKYFMPNFNYPWGFFYRRSIWENKGYVVPKTFDELVTLCKKIKSDGLIPIGFANQEGWPAMGTFDYINLRLNGHKFHVALCAHEESWDQQRVNEVFDTWKALLPYQDPNALGKTWAQSVQSLAKGESAMYLLGSFLLQQISDPKVVEDVDFFPFPEIAVEGMTAVEAPIDGLMLSKKGGGNQAARDMLAFMGTPEGQEAYFSVDRSHLMTAKGVDTSSYTELDLKFADIISSAASVTQFFDRDALPAMASNVLIPALQTFLKDGVVDTANLESQAKTLYAAQ